MTTHRAHPVDDPPGLDRADPGDAILFDSCDRCRELASAPWLLDDRTLADLMKRIYDAERGGHQYRSANEADAGALIWGVALGIGRVTELPLWGLLGIAPGPGAFRLTAKAD